MTFTPTISTSALLMVVFVRDKQQCEQCEICTLFALLLVPNKYHHWDRHRRYTGCRCHQNWKQSNRWLAIDDWKSMIFRSTMIAMPPFKSNITIGTAIVDILGVDIIIYIFRPTVQEISAKNCCKTIPSSSYKYSTLLIMSTRPGCLLKKTLL